MKLYITFNFECDNCVNIYNQIKKKYNYLITNYIEESTHIIAIGGDGYLLVCLNKFISYNKKRSLSPFQVQPPQSRGLLPPFLFKSG